MRIQQYFYSLCLWSCLFSPLYLAAQSNPAGKKGEKKEGGKKGGGGGKMTHVTVSPGNMIAGVPTDNSITISIMLEPGQEAYIAYGTSSGKLLSRTNQFRADSRDPQEISITSLKRNTRYYYQLHYRPVGEKEFTISPESWFATRRDPETVFSFAVQGDSHPEREGKMFHPQLYRQTLQQAAALQPDFYFMMGDDFNIDRLLAANSATKENVEQVYKVQRHYMGNPGTNPPLFLVNGNHEQAARYLLNGSPDNIAVQAGLARKKYFPLPAPGAMYSGDQDTVQHVGLLKDYYAFEWGNALFVVIDPYWHSDVAVDNQPGAGENKKREPWSATLGKTQYEWLKQTLAGSKAAFKFVFAHHVNGTGRGGVERASFFEWGGKGQNGQWQFDRFRPGWEMPIHQLFVKYKVTIFFQGHDHLFARQELDGVIYQSVPNPADDTHTAFNKEAYTSGDILPNSGFLHVTVDKKEVRLEYIRSWHRDRTDLPEDATRGFSYIIRK